MSSIASNRSFGPLPIVIGITGHRDLRLEDEKVLKTKIRNIFAEFRERYPHTPLVLLSPLAEGADRLGAWVALEFGVRLIVPLPLPRALYEADFHTSASLAEFEQLLQQADQVFALPLLPDYTERELQEGGEARAQQYAQLSAYLCEHSQILIALWDGIDCNLTGGVAQTVQFYLEGVPAPYVPQRKPLDSVKSDPVYYIATPRKSNPNPADKAFSKFKLFPKSYINDIATTATYARIYSSINNFNRDAIYLGSKLRAEQRQSKKNLLEKATSQLKTIPNSVQSILNDYALADSLSLYFQQRRYLPILRSLFFFAFLIVLFFEGYDNILRQSPLLLLLHLAMLGLAFGLYEFTRRANDENKYLDYRALAEGLRIQFFWEIAGIKESVATYYLRKQRSELNWIRYATRIFWSMSQNCQTDFHHSMQGRDQIEHLELVQKYWVEAELNYFAQKANQNQNLLTRFRRCSQRCLLLSVILSFSLLIIHTLYSWGYLPQLDLLEIDNQNPMMEIKNRLMALISWILLLSALLSTYAEKRALAEQAKQYEQMWWLFSNANDRFQQLKEAKKYNEAKLLIKELGTEALAENGDWIKLHRQRPIEVPM